MINVRGVDLYVAIEQGDGNGPPLLLINGIGANLELFDPFIEALDSVGGQKKRAGGLACPCLSQE